MELKEINKFYNVSKKQLLFKLINILKSTTENVKKEKKKSAQNFFILKYIIERLKISKFYYLKIPA
jgi:hypothetical protein